MHNEAFFRSLRSRANHPDRNRQRNGLRQSLRSSFRIADTRAIRSRRIYTRRID
jgi:hypothetical protein